MDRRCSFVALDFVDWAATVRRKASNRVLQQVLLDDILTLGDLYWIQRWAALLPELVADFEDFDQIALGHEAQGQTAGWPTDRARKLGVALAIVG